MIPSLIIFPCGVPYMSCSSRRRGPVLIATMPPSPVLEAACFRRLFRMTLSSFEISLALTGSSGLGSTTISCDTSGGTGTIASSPGGGNIAVDEDDPPGLDSRGIRRIVGGLALPLDFGSRNSPRTLPGVAGAAAVASASSISCRFRSRSSYPSSSIPSEAIVVGKAVLNEGSFSAMWKITSRTMHLQNGRVYVLAKLVRARPSGSRPCSI